MRKIIFTMTLLLFFIAYGQIVPMSYTMENAQHVKDYNPELWCYDISNDPWVRDECSNFQSNDDILSYGDLGTSYEMVQDLEGAVVSLWVYAKDWAGSHIYEETEVHPFAEIFRELREDGKVQFQCTGVFISPRYILTADHCVSQYMTYGFVSDYEEKREVWAVTNHTKFKGAYVPEHGDDPADYLQSMPKAEFFKIKMNEYSGRWNNTTEFSAAAERGYWLFVDPESEEYFYNYSEYDNLVDYSII